MGIKSQCCSRKKDEDDEVKISETPPAKNKNSNSIQDSTIDFPI